jgi:bifunctional DNase/RNase
MPKKDYRLLVPAVFVLVILSIAAISAVNFINFDDYVPVDILEVSGSTVVLGNNCTAIISETSPERAYAIETGQAGIIDQRPNTHDIFAETLKSFNISLEYVTIDSYEDGIYYANLYLNNDEKALKLDAKPSDCIAMALRTNSTIYINKTLLEEMGTNIC